MIKISPSQVKKFKRCPRLWGIEYIWRIKPEVTPNQQKAFTYGTQFHTAMEMLIQSKPTPKDIPADIVRLAQTSISATDWAGEWLLEEPLSINIENLFTIHGIVDAHLPGDTVRDFKTTSDWRYAQTAEQMKEDPQVITYMFLAFANRAEWLYHKKGLKTPKPPRVSCLELSEAELNNAWEKEVLLPAYEMHSLKVKPPENPFEIETGDTSVCCDEYGGCAFKNVCTVAKLGGDMSKLFKDLAAKKAKQSESITPPEAKDAEPVNPLKVGPLEEKEEDEEGAEESVKEEPVKETKKRGRPAAKPTIYVGCLPHGKSVPRLELTELYQKAEAAVADQQDGLPWQLANYGQGPGKIATAVELALENYSIPKEGIFIDKFGPASAGIVQVFAKYGCPIIQGV